MHELPLINTIAMGFTAAWVLGLLTQRLGLSPIVGYLLAGVVIGPYTPGVVGDLSIAQQLAEIGVILLMFGVGLHFHLKELLAVKGVAIPGAIGQSLVATVVSVIVFEHFGVSTKGGIVLGVAMSVASTVVLMRVLMDSDRLSSHEGHVAVGWLVVEDIFTVIVLVLIPVLAGGGHGHDAAEANLWVSLAMAMVKLAVLVFIVMVVGSRVIPWALVQVARLRSRELFTLSILVFSIAIAFGSFKFFGASMALGAFLAGMVVAQSPVSQQAAADILPLRDAFAVLFFVSVGMLFDPAILVHDPLIIVAALGVIFIAKPLAALLIVAALGHSARTALTVAVGLAQIGEFSFILAEVASHHEILPAFGRNVLVAAAIISITVNPLLFRSLPAIEKWLQRRPLLWRLLNARAAKRSQQTNAEAAAQIAQLPVNDRHAVVVGYGPVGRSVEQLLREAGIETVIIDLNMDTVSSLTRSGRKAIYGDASHEGVLEKAGIARASHLVLTLPQASDRAAIVSAARHLNANVRILVRARYLSERRHLEQAGATAAVFEEAEAAVGLARLVLAGTGASREIVERSVRDIRLRLIQENVSNLRGQTVRGIMVPWTRVWRILRSATMEEVLRQVAKQRFSRWPVVDSGTAKPVGYLLVTDLVAGASLSDWTSLIRPLRSVRPTDDIEATLVDFQREGATIAIVEENGQPLGIITVEDIIEQVVGRIEDEYPREDKVALFDVIRSGGVALDVVGCTPADAITELARMISPVLLPPDADIAALALAREDELPTDLGVGVAIPHARCPKIGAPVAVFGRSSAGISFSAEAPTPVRLLFLLVTPAEEPELQVMLLGQIARLVGNPAFRDRLLSADSAADVLDVIAESETSKKSG